MSFFNLLEEWSKLVLGNLRLRKKEYQNHSFTKKAENENSTSGRGARTSYQTMLPEISARRSLLEPRFKYLSAPRPYVTDPFRPLRSIHSNESLPCTCQRFPVSSSKWYVKVYHGTVDIQKLRMCFSKTMSLRLKTINQITWTSIL